MSDATPQPSKRNEQASVGEVIDFVKTYAKQETVGPLKNAGRFIAMGAAGAIALGLGLALVMLGLLRFLQSEWEWAQTAGKSWMPYGIVLVATGVLIAGAVMQINKTYLDKEDKR